MQACRRRLNTTQRKHFVVTRLDDERTTGQTDRHTRTDTQLARASAVAAANNKRGDDFKNHVNKRRDDERRLRGQSNQMRKLRRHRHHAETHEHHETATGRCHNRGEHTGDRSGREHHAIAARTDVPHHDERDQQ